jgi:hypothetical protein
VRAHSCWIAVQVWLLLRKTNPSSRRRGDLNFKRINGLRTNKYLVIGPAGLGTKNDCAGEGQQQFTGPPVEDSWRFGGTSVDLYLITRRWILEMERQMLRWLLMINGTWNWRKQSLPTHSYYQYFRGHRSILGLAIITAYTHGCRTRRFNSANTKTHHQNAVSISRSLPSAQCVNVGF